MKNADLLTALKAIISLMVVLVAFAFLLLFKQNQESIVNGGNFTSFMSLLIIGSGLLIYLVFLVNNSKHVPEKKKVASKKRKK